MSIVLRHISVFIVLAGGIGACGGRAPQGQTPSPAAPSSQAPQSGSAASDATRSTEKGESSASSDATIRRTLADRIFAPTMAYMFNDGGSAATETRRQECEKKFPENPSAQASCREKDRAKFVADVLVFEKKNDEGIFTVYRRAGSSLVEISKSKVSIAEDTPQTVKLKVLSEKGWRAIFNGKKEIVVGYSSDSSIEIQDPTYGKLAYEARIGLLSQGQEQKK